jgi:phage terminase large subunit
VTVVRTLTVEEQQQAARNVVDPVRYSDVYLRANTWSEQQWILRAISRRKRVAVKACHASGKTFAAALAVIWWISRWKDGIAVTTAPTWLQVETILWGQIAKVLINSRVDFPKPKVTELWFGPNNYAIGLSTNEADRFQGFHEGHVLIVLDEGPGVRAPIYEAIDGIRAGGMVCELALGNPTIASGPFYEAFSSLRASWITRTISAFHTPNLLSLHGGDISKIDELNDGNHDAELVKPLLSLSDAELNNNVRPYLTTRDWVKEKWFEWFLTGSPLWDARVMGRFPKQSVDFLIPLAWAEMAKFREVKRHTGRRTLDIGIDVAGPGEDETVMYVLEGDDIVDLFIWASPDPRGEVVAALKSYGDTDMRIKVDELGLGHYFILHIMDNGFPVVGVNVQSTETSDSERYLDVKAENYWGLRERFEEGRVRGLIDDETISQLTSIKYDHDPKGRIRIESKKHMKKRGVRSPDRAEALMLASADVSGSGEIGFV